MKNQANEKNRMLLIGVAVLLSLSLAKTSFTQEQGAAPQSDQVGAPVISIKDTNAAIIEKHAKWVAGETALSRLSRLEQQLRVGLNFTPVQAELLPELSSKGLPSNLDWRDHDGNNVTSPKDQKSCGSCWAFAMTGGVESYVLLTQKKSISLSEQALLDCSGVGSCNGGTLNADFLQNTGLPSEDEFPYLGRDLTLIGRLAWCRPHSDWRRHTYKVGGWGTIASGIDSIKASLVNYGPLPTAMMVYEDFMHYKAGIYSFTTGKKMGGHAVLLVGYNDAEQYFIVKNSWGTEWGENGFFRIAYSEVGNVVQFGFDTIAYRAQASEFMASSALPTLPNAGELSSASGSLQ